MAKRPSSGQCVHCLQFHDELTLDHVFPDAWYPDTTRENTEKWKVPSCGPCNSAHGKNEEELLIRLGLCIAPDEDHNMGIADKALRALAPAAGKSERDKAARASHRARIRNESKSGPSIPRQAIYPGFGPHAGVTEEEQVAITISARGLEQLTEKVVRGITYLAEAECVNDCETPWFRN